MKMQKPTYEELERRVSDQGDEIVKLKADIQTLKESGEKYKVLIESALIESEAKLELFFSQSLTGFFFMMLDEPVEWNDKVDKSKVLDYVFKHQKITKINQAMLDQYGATEKEFIGKTPNELFYHDIPYGKSIWKDFFDKGHLHIETDERKFDGTAMFIEGDYVCLYDKVGRITGHFGIQQDITQRKIYERKLQESEVKFREYTQSAPVGIYITNMNGDCIYANRKWLEMAGMNMEEAKGKGWINALHPEERQSISEKWYKSVESNGNWGYEYRFMNREGRVSWIYGMAAPLHDHEGKTYGYLGTNMDITQRKKAEEELRLRENQLSDLNATKDKFFSIIAHDLKSPFNSIMGFSDLLIERIREKKYEGIEKFTTVIQRSSQQAMDLLVNLLEWSRTQSGKIEFNPEFIELSTLIEEVRALLENPASQKNIKIFHYKHPSLVVFADKHMIGTVIRNLISNAIKFTKPGGQIKIKTAEQDHEVMVAIEDNGVGIKEENIKSLFRIDLDYSTHGTSDEKGTGLGLILCKEFIDQHQGKIWVDSRAGEGSTFSFSIPLQK
nr:PAS domain-containing sensor histidine kinase [Bacteroidota bacterium]